jgi:hypothetical protein
MAPPEPNGPVREHEEPTLMVLGASAAKAVNPQEDNPPTQNTPTNTITNKVFFIVVPPFLWFLSLRRKLSFCLLYMEKYLASFLTLFLVGYHIVLTKFCQTIWKNL